MQLKSVGMWLWCMSSWAVTVDIISINDLHGMLTEQGKTPGLAKIAQFMDEYQKKQPNMLFVGAGDLYQGSAMSNLTYGKPVNELLKMMNLKATAVGNHEFDWGDKHFPQWKKELGAPFLAANVIHKKSRQSPAWSRPYTVLHSAGKKIALIGLSTQETPFKTKAEGVRDLEFMSASDTAKRLIPLIKQREKPDAIIALTHIASYQDQQGSIRGDDHELEALALVEGLDGIITGHSHQKVAGYLGRIPIVQGAYWGRGLGLLSLNWNDQTHALNITPKWFDMTAEKERVQPKVNIQEKIAQYEQAMKPLLSEVLGVSPLGSSHDRNGRGVTPLGYWLSEAIRTNTHADVAIMNGGGIRRGLNAGNITMGDLYEILPFDNEVVVLSLTGLQVKQAIEHGLGSGQDKGFSDGQFSGVLAQVDWTKPYGQRLQSLRLINGDMIDDDKPYKVAVNDFMAEGGDMYPLAKFKAKPSNMVMRDIAREALLKNKNIPSGDLVPVWYVDDLQGDKIKQAS